MMSEPNEKKRGSIPTHERNDDVRPLPAEDVVNVGGEQGQSGTADDHSDRPRRDHSEREGGSDQDIDTAGQVPGNKATDNKEPVGF
jgi:hypothetical protein